MKIESQTWEILNVKNYYAPDKKRIRMTLWCGSDGFIERYNQFGMLLNNEEIELTKDRIKGKTTNIIIHELNYQKLNLKKKTNSSLNLSGTIIQYKYLEFDIRNWHLKPYFIGIDQQKYSYKPVYIHKFILLTDNAEYFAVEYYGNINLNLHERVRIEIVKGLLTNNKIIIANEIISAPSYSLDSEEINNNKEEPIISNINFPQRFLKFSDFENTKLLKGKIIEKNLIYIDSLEYRNWLFKHSNIFNFNKKISIIKEYCKQYHRENLKEVFRLPVYQLQVLAENNRIINFILRPIWYQSFELMEKQVPIPYHEIGDSIEISFIEYKCVNYASYLQNFTINSYCFTNIDFDIKKNLEGNILEIIEITGKVVSDVITLFFGFDIDCLKAPPYPTEKYNTIAKQTIFRLADIKDFRIISCKTELSQNEYISLHKGLKINATGKISENGVFVINKYSIC